LFGGSQKLDGVLTGEKTDEHQIRLTYMQSITPTWLVPNCAPAAGSSKPGMVRHEVSKTPKEINMATDLTSSANPTFNS
jgi:hypothetical protein